MKTVLFVVSRIYRCPEMFDLYIMYVFVGPKVNHTSSKNAA